MRLPGGERAIIAPAKLGDYLLSPAHWHGEHKARVFASALGLRSSNAAVLEAALLRAAVEQEAVLQQRTAYGSIYVVRFEMHHADRSAMIRSVWIIPDGQSRPEFVTAIVE